jgi:hypothetical protein
MSTKQSQDIDYLHPDGKPAAPAQKQASEEEAALAERDKDKAIAEVDGHHMCSPSCQHKDHKP